MAMNFMAQATGAAKKKPRISINHSGVKEEHVEDEAGFEQAARRQLKRMQARDPGGDLDLTPKKKESFRQRHFPGAAEARRRNEQKRKEKGWGTPDSANRDEERRKGNRARIAGTVKRVASALGRKKP